VKGRPGYFLLANSYLPGRSSIVSEAAVLQVSKSLDLTIVLAVGCILVGCAAQSVVQKPLAAVEAANSHLGRMSNVRTTAYTRIEKADAETRSANIYPAIMS
jgi:hypothetical protein